MTHAETRIEERLTKAGWSAEDQAKLQTFAKGWASQLPTAGHTRTYWFENLQDMAADWGEASNGNEVWAIYRAQRLVTVMLRRSTQPDSNLRCKKVNRLV